MPDPACPVTEGQEATISAVWEIIRAAQVELPRPVRILPGDAQALLDFGVAPSTVEAATAAGIGWWIDEYRAPEGDGFCGTVTLPAASGDEGVWIKTFNEGPRTDLAHGWRYTPPPAIGGV